MCNPVSVPEMADEVKKQLYVLPVKVKFLKEQQNIFNENITNYVRKKIGERNSID
ncbi:hypothetical protein EZS27_044556 [termite gut metagenome]|uniref:Uncharacterized protein n=1 Tax=termite gut metagenome TaxID=433724 RepID=A0A5J4P592_9ZZZZ